MRGDTWGHARGWASAGGEGKKGAAARRHTRRVGACWAEMAGRTHRERDVVLVHGGAHVRLRLQPLPDAVRQRVPPQPHRTDHRVLVRGDVGPHAGGGAAREQLLPERERLRVAAEAAAPLHRRVERRDLRRLARHHRRDRALHRLVAPAHGLHALALPLGGGGPAGAGHGGSWVLPLLLPVPLHRRKHRCGGRRRPAAAAGRGRELLVAAVAGDEACPRGHLRLAAEVVHRARQPPRACEAPHGPRIAACTHTHQS
eukprot:4251100-Prymnesium_polylepis.1